MVACCCACRDGLGARLLWEASEIESGMLCCILAALVLIWDPLVVAVGWLFCGCVAVLGEARQSLTKSGEVREVRQSQVKRSNVR